MKFEEIERLVRLVAETEVDEVEVKRQGVEVRVRRRIAEAAAGQQVQVVPVGGGSPGPWSAEGGAAAPAPAREEPSTSGATEPEEDEDEGLHVITAAMVGTFYRRPTPDAEPFVKEGDVVKKGQVMFVLEAMKIFNEIESDASGTVVRFFAEEGQPVEYGEKLVALRPL